MCGVFGERVYGRGRLERFDLPMARVSWQHLGQFHADIELWKPKYPDLLSAGSMSGGAVWRLR